ncbi:facilitated trehalose transporter Tret1-like [Macrosteles quadrilineatus]|uniref:facilitated trehalose transporter Tret1-like n=1 Tax=Macrosteles quadrilineatus TaxID=74068 RepID=UPI0023E14AD5|nr:facilitated trehalose transporter Tret1-like [Macrosteles quadrilineatus]
MIFSHSSPESKAQFRQYWAAITVNIGMMSGGEYFGWPSPTLPKFSEPDAPFQITHDDITMMVSLLYLGNILSPIPTGYIMDRFGRKKSLIFCSIFPILSWILIVFAKSPIYLCISRLLAGIWVGIITTVAPMYTAEIASPKIRGALGNMFSFMTYLGTLFVYAIGPYVSFYTLAIIADIIPVYFLLMLISIPESPYYYLIHKNKQGAIQSLKWLRGGVEEEILEKEVNEIEEFIQKQAKSKNTVKAIFATRANRKAFFIVQLYGIFVKFAGIGILMAFNSITLPKANLGFLRPQECSIVLALIWVIFSVCSMFLVDRLGRKMLLTSTSFGCGVMMFIAGLWFYLQTNTTLTVEKVSWIPFACFAAHGIMYALGLGPIGTAIKGEMLSADIRASASAITSIVFALSSLFLNQTYLPIADNIGMYVNYWIYAASCFICALFTIFVFVETKGKSLQEIQQKLHKKKPKPLDCKANTV